MRPADIDEVGIGPPQTLPLRVSGDAYGFLTNGCEQLGEVTQHLEGRIFLLKLRKFTTGPKTPTVTLL